MTERRTPPGLLVLLATLTSLGPLSISFYLPALPYLAVDFGVTESQAQLTMTATLVGLGVGQVVIGTVSDALGRRLPLLCGLAGFCVVSLAITAVDSITMLVLLRVLQGFFGCAGIVLSRAVARDTSSGPMVARVNARLLLVITVTPLVAPTLGAQVLLLGSWRTMFVILGVLSGLFVVLVALALPETLVPGQRRRGGLRAAVGTYGTLLGDRGFSALVVVVGFVMAAYFTYLTASPFVFQDGFGLSSQQFGLLFGAGALMMITGTQLGGQFAGRARPERVAFAASGVALAGAAAMVLVDVTSSAGPGRLWPLLAALLPALCAGGLLLSTIQGVALSRHGPDAGSRAAILGAAQFGLGAVGAPLSGLFGSTALAMAGVMAAAFLCGTIALAVAVGQR